MSATDKKITIWVEKKYENQLIDELDNDKISWTKDDCIYTIINILGYRICKDIQFFSQLHSTLEKSCKMPFQISNQGIGVQIIVNQDEAVDVVQLLHKKYIEGEHL